MQIDCKKTPQCTLGLSNHGNKFANKEIQKYGLDPFFSLYSYGSDNPIEDIKVLILTADSIKGVRRHVDLFSNLLTKANINLDEVAFMPLTLCPRSWDRKPTDKETKTCVRTHLFPTIKQIQPKVIVPMGAQALKMLGVQGGVNSVHGQTFRIPLPADPDETLYTVVPQLDLHFIQKNMGINNQYIAKVIDDFRVVASEVNCGTGATIKDKTPNYQVIESIEDFDKLMEELNSVEFFAFDTETRGFRWNIEPVICYSFSWGYPGKTAVLPIRQHDPNGVPWKLKPFFSNEDLEYIKKGLVDLFTNPKVCKAAHNLKFDYLVTRQFLGVKIQGFLLDTIVLHHLLEEKAPHDLEFLGNLEFGYGPYGDKLFPYVGRGKEKKPYDAIPDQVLWPYTATDAEITYRLAVKYWPEVLADGGLHWVYTQESEELIRELAKNEWFGVPINEEKLNLYIVQLNEELAEILSQIRSYASPEFNPASPQQVVEVCKALGFEKQIKEDSKASGYSTDKNKLTELQDKHPFFGLMTKYRNLNKFKTTYLNKIKENMIPDQRLRYSWKIAGPETGRLAVTLYHQVPKIDLVKKEQGKIIMRDLFEAPEGKKCIHLDYSQVELRIMAIISNDEEMIRLFDRGADVHLATTAEILGLPEEGSGFIDVNGQSIEAKAADNRNMIGKPVNFGLVYGSEGETLLKLQWKDVNGQKYNLTDMQINSCMRNWRQRFNGITSYPQQVGGILRGSGGVMHSPAGRKRRFGNRMDYEYKKVLREAGNFPVQYMASYITNGTIVRVGKYLNYLIQAGRIREDDIYMLLTVHDSVDYLCSDYLVDWFVPILKAFAERPTPELANKSFPVDLGVGQTWMEAELNA